VGDDRIMAHGAFCAFEGDEKAIPGDSIGRQLPAIFNLAELREARRAQALFRDSWLAGIEVMAARMREGSALGLYLAAEGGHNGKSHNHNDVGNFLVYADGMPAIIDVGPETYTAKTFSPQRYEIWVNQSAYHNCPTIDGIMQSAGRQFGATQVSYNEDDRAAQIHVDLAKAYAPEAHLVFWGRTLRLDRADNAIVVVDDYRLTQAVKVITLTLMTPLAAQIAVPGEIRLPVTLSGKPVRVTYDASVLHAVVEEIIIHDGELRRCWGERLCRILLRADTPPLQSKWTLRITR